MLLATYDPNAQASCPKCGFVHCLNIGGNLAFSPRYMDFEHEECGTKWRRYIDQDRTELLNETPQNHT